MRERLILCLASLVFLPRFAGSTFAEAALPQRSYAEGTGYEASISTDLTAAPPAARPLPYPALQNKLFDIGTEVYHFEYEEPGLMEEKGLFYGLRFGYTGRGWVTPSPEASPADGGTMFRAEGRLAFGQVDYDGSVIDLETNDRTPYSMDDIDDWVFEGRLLLGADWLHRSALNTLYLGIGYRYLNDDTSFDPVGYERESNYLYLPVGYQFDGSNETGWSLGFGAEFDVFISGNQKSHLSDADPTYPDVDNRQDSGYGYRASIKLQHKSKNGIFVLEPFIRYWDIDDSEIEYFEVSGTTYEVVEPANETTEYGLSILWMF